MEMNVLYALNHVRHALQPLIVHLATPLIICIMDFAIPIVPIQPIEMLVPLYVNPVNPHVYFVYPIVTVLLVLVCCY